jgi:hypothetical protein
MRPSLERPRQSSPAPGCAPLPIRSDGLLGLLDQLLRDRESIIDDVFAGKDIGHRLRTFLLAAIALLACYGLTMGLMGFHDSWATGVAQMLVSALKVPTLLLLSTAICFPVLYVVQVLMGARLTFAQTLTLIVMALALYGILMASCAPVAFFFAVTGSTHDFMKLLHVLIFSFAGLWSMISLWLGLRAMCERSNLYPPLALRILKVWILVFAFVGTQMAWSLRPFVGSPGRPFQIFRQQEGNFYLGVWHTVTRLTPGPRDGTSQND